MNGMLESLHRATQSLLHQTEGVLTRELLQEPGRFGLGRLVSGQNPTATTDMVCGFCATGCGLTIHLRDRRAVGLSPATEYPVNLGMACPKGWEALAVLDAPDRATHPLLRDAAGVMQRVSWETALATFVGRMKSIQQRHGQHSIAFLGTGQIPCEELALLGSVAKFGMGLRHGDGNTRQCMATAVTAYKQSFGFDAPPYTYADFEESDVLVFVGANPCIAHPIMWERVMRNQRNPEIVVIDPRRTETAMQSTLHLPLRPKSDLTLFYGLANVLIANNWIEEEYVAAHTEGFAGFREFVACFDLATTSRVTGLPESSIRRLAEMFHERDRVSFWWTMGVNQSHEGTRIAQSLINLALLTGNIGRPGTGANSITGQCNAMGSRLFSNTTNLLGGHDFKNPGHRQKVADILGIDADRIPDQDSWSYHEILDGIERGEIRGLWVVATNPAHSWINQNSLQTLRSKLDFLVVQDMYASTETARIADLLLPTAAWGEKEGTFINSERRIGLLKKVTRPPGEALPDFAIFRLIAETWGCGEMFRRWDSPERVFEILREVSAGQPCDITGIEGYEHLDRAGGVQWPYPAASGDDRAERRLFEDGRFFTPDARAKFLFEEPRGVAEPVDEEYPLVLLTGRGTASQWHTQSRTAKSAVLRKLYPRQLCLEINPDDARKFGIVDGESVWVASRRDEVVAQALVTPTVQCGQVFLPMHYPDTNRLTKASFDPYSKQPSYKFCAVRVRPAGRLSRAAAGH